MLDNTPRDPTEYSLLTYGWIMVMSMLGGAASWFRKLRAGEVRPWNVVELVGELCIAWFVGVVTFYFCEAARFDQVLTAGIVGVCAHMGSRGIFMLERIGERVLAARLGVTLPKAPTDEEGKG